MRVRKWSTILALAAVAVACGDQITEVVPDRDEEPGRGGSLAAVPGDVAFAVTTTEDGVSISTDKDDYQPGDTVHFTGAGWPANDTLDILLEDEPATHEPHTWWVPVGEDGTFRDSTYVVDVEDLGVTFTLTATSRATGRVLTVQFTDGSAAVDIAPSFYTANPGTVRFSVLARNVSGGTAAGCIRVTLPSGYGAVTLVHSSFGVAGWSASVGGTGNRTITATGSPGIPASGSNNWARFEVEVQAPSATTADWTALVADNTGCTTNPNSVPAAIQVGGAAIQRTYTADFRNVSNAVIAETGQAGVAKTFRLRITNTSGSNGDDLIYAGIALPYCFTGLTGVSASTSNGGDTDFAGTPEVKDNFIRLTGGVLKKDVNPDHFVQVTFTATPQNGCPPIFRTAAWKSSQHSSSEGDMFVGNHPTISVQAPNSPPSVDAGGPYTVTEGSELTLSPTVSDPDGNPLTYQWSVNTSGIDAGGSCSFDNPSLKNAKVSCTDDSQGAPGGKFTLTLQVSDGIAAPVSDNADLTVGNANPIANAGGPYSGDEGVAIQLNGSADDPGNNDDSVLGYNWTVVTAGMDAGGACNFDNPTSKTAKITCTDDGSFKVRLVVTDDDGGISQLREADLTVANVAPTANAGGPYSGDEGAAIQLSGSGDDQGNNDDPHLTYQWTAITTGIDPGGACTFDDATSAAAKVTCTDDGAFKVRLVVSDDDGGVSAFNEATLTVANAGPVAEAGGGPTGYTGNEGSPVQLNGSVTDAGANDTHTWSWQYLGTNVDPGATCSFSNAAAEDPTVTCTDDGTIKLTLTVTDDDGASHSDDATLTLANVAPVAHAGGPYSGAEGTAIQLAGSATDAGSNDLTQLGYQWTAITTGIDAGGTCTFDNAASKDATITCTDDGAFKVRLVVSDDDGGTSVASEADLTVANVAPVAEAGGNYTGQEGSPVQLNGSVTDAGANDIHTWSWQYMGTNVDPGATCSFSNASAQDPTVTCTDDGTVKLTLTVTDDDGGMDTDDATLTLANVAPTANAGGPYSGDEGSAIQLNGSGDDQGNNDDPHLTYQWTAITTGIDPGGACTFDDATSAAAKVTCTDDGAFTVRLVVSDDDGGTSVASEADLTVANAGPIAEAGGGANGYSGHEGSPVALNGSVTDAGANDTHTWSWQYLGTNVDPGATCSFSNASAQDPTVTCTDDGTVKLTLTVTDDDGASHSDDATLTLANVAPVATAGGPYAGDEGMAIQLAGSGTDAGSNDIPHLGYQWTVITTGIDAGGSCSFDNAASKNATVTCTDDGAFTVRLVVSDDDGGTSVASEADLTVANAAPIAEAGGNYTGSEGSPVQLNGSVTDAGANDTHTWSWQYLGTNVDPGATCSFSSPSAQDPTVTCTDDGTVKLTLTVTDDDGDSSSDDATLSLANVAPTADAGGPYAGDEGTAIQLAGSGDDAGANDVPGLTYQWTAITTGIDAGGSCSFDNAASKNAKVTCTDDGAFTVRLVVSDDDGGTSVASEADLAVANAAPIAEAGGPYNGSEGSAVQLNGTVTDLGANDTHLWSWQYVAGVGLDGGTCAFDNANAQDPKVTCTDDGTVELTLTVTDDDGDWTDDTATLTLANVDPVANAGGNYTGTEGSPVQLSGSVTDVGANDTHTWSWQYLGTNVDPGASCGFSSASAEDPTITCTDDGTVKLTLTVRDDDGGVDTDEATLTLTNVNPVAGAGGPYAGDEGAAIPLTGTATDAGSNDDLATSWAVVPVSGVQAGATCSFNPSASALSPSVSCTDNGTYQVTLTVTDDDGGAHSAHATLTLENVAPVANAGSSYTGNEGAAVQLNGSVTDAGANDTHTWSWQYLGTNVDPGATCSFSNEAAEDPTVTCTDDGSVKLTLTVTDDDGASHSDDATLTLANLDPVATAGGPYAGTEGSQIPLNGAGSDPGANDIPDLTYQWAIDFSGIEPGGTCSLMDPTSANAKVTCTDNGSVQLTLTVTDGDGGSGSSITSLAVTNGPPVITAMRQPDGSPLPTTIFWDEVLSIRTTFIDPGSNDSHTAQIDCSTGYTPVGGGTVNSPFTASCSFTSASVGSKIIQVMVADDDNGFDVESFTVLIKRRTFLLALDDEAITKAKAPTNFSDNDVNESSAKIGYRTQLAGFGSRLNQKLNLPSGQVGDEGWFAIRTIPSKWPTAGPTTDGARNLLLAGPGLGSGSNREAYLDKVPGVTPLRATGLKMLIGHQVCAVVWKSDVSIDYDPVDGSFDPINGSLKGDNRGIVAFVVNKVTRYGSGSTLPVGEVTVVDAAATCAEPLMRLMAPIPKSSSLPNDTVP